MRGGWEDKSAIEKSYRKLQALEKLRLACRGVRIRGKLCRLITQLFPFGMKVYGKFNEIGLIAVPGVFEFDEPLCV